MKSLLLGLLVGVALTAPADSFYLLSKEREASGQKNSVSPPLPFNPHPAAPRYRIVDDIWLVDDSAFAPTNSSKQSIEETGLVLAARVQKAREIAAQWALTNPPAPMVLLKPRPPFTNWYNTTDFDLGLAIHLMERDYPGIRTNFTPEQLRIAPNNTNFGRPMEGLQQLPDYINIYSPTYKEDLKKWQEEHMIEKVPDPKTSGGGDYGFYLTASYQLTVRPLPAPTAQDYPFFNGTNLTWPSY